MRAAALAGTTDLREYPWAVQPCTMGPHWPEKRHDFTRDRQMTSHSSLVTSIRRLRDDEIPTTEVVYTILGGRIAYDASSGGH
jgi:hypothetical protein